jgi:hypothetical protein
MAHQRHATGKPLLHHVKQKNIDCGASMEALFRANFRTFHFLRFPSALINLLAVFVLIVRTSLLLCFNLPGLYTFFILFM